MAGYRSFGPAVTDGIPVTAGQTFQVRVSDGDEGLRTLTRIRFGIHQLAPAGGGGFIPLPPPSGPQPLPPVGPPPENNMWLAAVGTSDPHLVVDVDTSVSGPSPWPPAGWTPWPGFTGLMAVGTSDSHLVGLIDTGVSP